MLFLATRCGRVMTDAAQGWKRQAVGDLKSLGPEVGAQED